jgi:hypothetical protein
MIKDFFNHNDDFRFLKDYYSLSNSAKRYGVERMEIKHSNLLAWILNPSNAGSLGTKPIKDLLKLIQHNTIKDNTFKTLDLNKAILTDVNIKRESYNIDLLITLKIDGIDYAIIIENKVYSSIHGDQLRNYKTTIAEEQIYSHFTQVCAFLYTDYQDKNYISGQLEQATNEGYTPISYQEVYEEVLLPITKYSTNNEQIFILADYIHCLASHTTDTGNEMMIITDRDKESLTNLFKEEQMLTFIDKIRDSKDSNEYTEFYNENKPLFLLIFSKYLVMALQNNETSLVVKLDSIIYGKRYIMNKTSFRGIGELLKNMITTLAEKGYTYDDLDNRLNHLYSDPLIVPVKDIQNVNHPRWFTNNEKMVDIEGTTYYILSAWNSWDYEELKNKINELDMGITLE